MRVSRVEGPSGPSTLTVVRVRRSSTAAETLRIPAERQACLRCRGTGRFGRTRGEHREACPCPFCRPCPRCGGRGTDPEVILA